MIFESEEENHIWHTPARQQFDYDLARELYPKAAEITKLNIKLPDRLVHYNIKTWKGLLIVLHEKSKYVRIDGWALIPRLIKQ